MKDTLKLCVGRCRRAHQTLIENVMTILVLLSILGGGFLFWYYKIDGRITHAPLTFEHDPMRIELEREVYRPGEMVRGEVSFCKTRDFSAEIQWALADGHLVYFPTRPAISVPVGCYPVSGGRTLIDIERVPSEPDLIGHEVEFEGNATVTLPGDRAVTYTFRTQRFTVVE